MKICEQRQEVWPKIECKWFLETKMIPTSRFCTFPIPYSTPISGATVISQAKQQRRHHQKQPAIIISTASHSYIFFFIYYFLEKGYIFTASSSSSLSFNPFYFLLQIFCCFFCFVFTEYFLLILFPFPPNEQIFLMFQLFLIIYKLVKKKVQKKTSIAINIR